MSKIHKRRAQARKNDAKQVPEPQEVKKSDAAPPVAYHGTAPRLAHGLEDSLPNTVRLYDRITSGRFLPPLDIYVHIAPSGQHMFAAAQWETAIMHDRRNYAQTVARGPIRDEQIAGPGRTLGDMFTSRQLPFGAAIDTKIEYGNGPRERCGAYGAVMLFAALETNPDLEVIAGLDPSVSLVDTTHTDDQFRQHLYEAQGGGFAVVSCTDVTELVGVPVVTYAACYASDKQRASKDGKRLDIQVWPEDLEHPSIITTVAPRTEQRQMEVCSTIASMTLMLAAQTNSRA
jgi:hypothetical protein